MGVYVPFEYSDRLLWGIMVGIYASDPGRFSPEFKWRRQLLSIVERSLAPRRILATGSWSHGTALAGLSDRDYFLVFPGAPPDQPRTVLGNLYADLGASVSASTEVWLDSPAVCVTDPYTGLTVDLVPAYREGSADYLIPDSTLSSWMPTDPVAHITYLTHADSTGEGVRGAIRLMKYWKARTLPGLSSLYLEMVTASHYLAHPRRHYLEYLTGVLAVLSKTGLVDVPDPSLTHSRPLAAFSDPTVDRAEAVHRVAASRDLAWRIEAAEKSHAVDDVAVYLDQLFSHAAPPHHSRKLAKPSRRRRDPNEMRFRGSLAAPITPPRQSRRKRSR